jgi:release factor glutamine methyltransferase
MRILAPPGVFRPISDTWLLAAALRRELRPGAAVLDLCTGSGAIAISAARAGARVTAVDLSRRATWAARLNGRINGVQLRVLRGSLFEPVGDERFDFIVSNPPYVPAEDADLPARGVRRAWDAGHDGRVLLDRILDEAPRHLRPGGALLVVQSTIIGEEETLERLSASRLSADVVERREGPLGPLMAGRREHLEAQGLLAPGQDREELLVIRGRRAGALAPAPA